MTTPAIKEEKIKELHWRVNMARVVFGITSSLWCFEAYRTKHIIDPHNNGYTMLASTLMLTIPQVLLSVYQHAEEKRIQAELPRPS
jgi:hypothetical protein